MIRRIGDLRIPIRNLRALSSVVIPFLAVLAVISGVYGFMTVNLDRGLEWGAALLEAFLSTCGFFMLENISLNDLQTIPFSLHVARSAAVVAVAWSASVVFRRAFALKFDLLTIWVALFLRRRITVICGCGWRGQAIAHQILAEDKMAKPWHRRLVVTLDPRDDNPFKDQLTADGAIFLTGDATSREWLQRARIANASEVFVTAPDDETNCRIVRRVAKVKREACDRHRKRGQAACDDCDKEDLPHARCFAHVADNRLRRALSDEIRATRPCIDLVPFDTCETTARVLLTSHDHAADKNYRPDHPLRSIRTWVLGGSDMARAIVLQLLRCGQLAEGSRIQINWFVPDAEKTGHAFRAAYPSMDPVYREQNGIEELCEEAFPELLIRPLAESNAQLRTCKPSDMGCDDDPGLPSSPDDALLATVGEGSDTEDVFYVCIDGGTASRSWVEILRPFLQAKAAPKVNAEAGTRVYCYVNEPELVGKALTKRAKPGALPIIVDHRIIDPDKPDHAVLHVYEFVDAIGRIAPNEVGKSGLDALARLIYDDYMMQDLMDRLHKHVKESEIISPDQNRYIKKALKEIKDALMCNEADVGALDKKLVGLCRQVGLDDGRKEWAALTESERDSNRYAANHAGARLRALGLTDVKLCRHEGSAPITFDETEKNLIGKMEHRRWCAEKLLDGMLPLPLTDNNARAWKHSKGKLQSAGRHICLQTYAPLPTDEKRKDIDQFRSVFRFARERAKNATT